MPARSLPTHSLPESLCHHVMEQVPDAIVVADCDGVVLHVNRQALAMFNGRGPALVGYTLFDLLPGSERKHLENALARLNDGGRVMEEFTLHGKGGATVRTEVSASRVVDDSTGTAVLVGVFRNIEGRRAEEKRRLAREKRQREVLVREVHHRIKNHLQALVGLIFRETARHPESRPVFAHVMTQINSIAVVHGLQGSTGNDAVNLCDMVASMCQVNEEVRGVPGRLKPVISIPRPAVVAESECVPIALLLNELISNAMKHSSDDAAPVAVEVSGCVETGVAEVRINNTGCLSDDFDLSGATDLSSGLGLVRALLPSRGVRFTLENSSDGNQVVTRLVLEKPVVSIGKVCGRIDMDERRHCADSG